MRKGKKSIRNIAGCRINEFEQTMYDELLPYNWDKIYLSFKEEMTMFNNVVHLAKNVPEGEMTPIAGCKPEQYLPLVRCLERIYDSIKRLEEVPENSMHSQRIEGAVNSKVKDFASRH